MSKKKNDLEDIIKILIYKGLKPKEIYDSVNIERMDFYNIRRSTSRTKQEELAAKLREEFAQILQQAATEEEATTDLTEELIQTLKRENELLRQMNEERFTRILKEIEELKKRFPE